MKRYLLAYQEMLDPGPPAHCQRPEPSEPVAFGLRALAGTTHPIDRTCTAKQLGFSSACNNFWTVCRTVVL